MECGGLRLSLMTKKKEKKKLQHRLLIYTRLFFLWFIHVDYSGNQLQA